MRLLDALAGGPAIQELLQQVDPIDVDHAQLLELGVVALAFVTRDWPGQVLVEVATQQASQPLLAALAQTE